MEPAAPGSVVLPPVLEEPVPEKERPFAPGLIVNGCVVALALFFLWTESAPHWEGGLMGWFISVILAVALAGYWIVALLIVVVRDRHLDHLLRWACLPVVAILTVVAVEVRVPLLVRFEVSRGAMDSLAHQVMSTPPRARFNDQRFGLFHATDVERIGGGVRFTTGECFIDPCGFAYIPGRVPTDTYNDSYDHLRGPWYVWTGRSD